MNKEVTVQIPGRICIMGDKVDLLGKPVIGMAIDLLMTVDYRAREDSLIEFRSHDTNECISFNLGDSPPRDNSLSYWSVLYERMKGQINQGFTMEVKSDIPIGAGLSTSAAISIGFIKAIDEAYKLGMSNYDIAELAYRGENHDLGIQCGRLDQYTEAFGGVVFIHTDENPRVEPLDIEELPIVVGDSMEERKASSILNRIKNQIRDEDKETLEAFKVIEECVYGAREALEKKEFEKLGKLMDRQQSMERILEADTPKIVKMCEAARDAGALGAKQMGAGGGGCMLAIAPSKDNLSDITKNIEKVGGKAWIFNIFKY